MRMEPREFIASAPLPPCAGARPRRAEKAVFSMVTSTIATAHRGGCAVVPSKRSRRARGRPAARIRRNGNRMADPLAAGVIAVILKGYPRLSETFIAQE